MCTHYALTKLRIGEHLEYVPLFVTPLKHHEMILGYGWLKRHDPSISWIRETLKFHTNYCRSHCLRHHTPYEHAHDYSNLTRYELPLPQTLTGDSTADTNTDEDVNVDVRCPLKIRQI